MKVSLLLISMETSQIVTFPYFGGSGEQLWDIVKFGLCKYQIFYTTYIH